MLMSLQRRQQQEEAKARKEIDLMQRREKEREKEDERVRKKEEMMIRRQQILEQHRLKKALEEAEREGKTLDRNTEMLLKQQQHHSAAPTPKMRAQKTNRARPKTIHVEPSSIDISEASSLGSRSKKGSNSNLTGIFLDSRVFAGNLHFECFSRKNTLTKNPLEKTHFKIVYKILCQSVFPNFLLFAVFLAIPGKHFGIVSKKRHHPKVFSLDIFVFTLTLI